MINCIKCSDADKADVFKAFSEGFSDYMIKLEVDQDIFLNHFFGAEGNKMELSWLALDGDKPVGLVLGGIRDFDGMKTLRCGTMCVIPSYRKQGVAAKLLEKHKETARNERCGQMFLECISGNERALAFYRKQGYEKVYDLSYFTCSNPQKIIPYTEGDRGPLNISELRELRNSWDGHINWQNEMDYLEKIDVDIWGVFAEGKAIAAIAWKNTKIHFIYVKKDFRGKNLGRGLVAIAAEGKDKLTTSFTNSSSLRGFYGKLGFKCDEISQVEMYRSPY